MVCTVELVRIDAMPTNLRPALLRSAAKLNVPSSFILKIYKFNVFHSNKISFKTTMYVTSTQYYRNEH